MKNNRLTVYADLNCPFCYALHESLMASDYIGRVDWRIIEHAPQISFDTKDIQVQSELNAEVSKVETLAPDIIINVPSGRPNTRIANEVLSEIQQSAPEQVDHFRALLYRALWIDGTDISDPVTIEGLLRKTGIVSPNIEQGTRAELQQWQEEWEQGDFSRNIPALLTDDGNKLLGLPSPRLLTLFICGDRLNIGTESDAICTLHPRQKIIIATSDTDLGQNLSEVLGDYEVQVYTNNEEAVEVVQSSSPPDLIFLDVQSEGNLACRTISERTQTRIIPIILLTDIRDDTSEAQAFEVGAADFIQKNIAPSVLKARTRTLLRLKRANDLLDEVARMDPLTEIPNRREYDRVINLEWRQSVRTSKPFSIILIDIDHFKEYNDNYGHVEGDTCLRRLAHLLQHSIHRPTDSVARYGGEEFVIILPGTDEKGAMNVAQLIKDQLQKLNIPHSNAPESRQLTISQGVASCTPTVSEKPETIVIAADRALYEAKRRGRNQIVYSEPA